MLEAAFDGGFDSVVHLAAVTSVLRSLEQPDLTFATNVAGTHALLEAARGAGASSLVFASTNAVTGPMEAPGDHRGGDAAAADAVRRDQGRRRDADVRLHRLLRAALRVPAADQRLRPGMQAKDSIVARLMRAIRLGRTFEIYGDGRQVRDYVHATTSSPRSRLGLVNEDWKGPVVIGPGTSLSVLEVVDAVRAVTGAELTVAHGPAGRARCRR